MNCSNRNAACLRSLGASLLLAAASLSACTSVDDRLGANLLPINQRMEIEITSRDNSIKTYLYRPDSLPSKRLGVAYIGRQLDPDGVFGAVSNSVLVQFVPNVVPFSAEQGYGLLPIIDSMRIVMAVSGLEGDATKEQRFDVYDVAEGPEPLSRGKDYYTNFPIDDYKGPKLFEFTHSGVGNVAARLVPTAAGKEYLEELVHTDMENYADDSLFRRKFRGLYITPADTSPVDAAVYRARLVSSSLELYVRNHDSLDVAAIRDTLRVEFTLTDSDTSDDIGQVIPIDNVSINMASFDYTGSTLGILQDQTNNFTDTLPTSPTLPVVYVQPMGGVGTYLRFTDELIDDIRNLRYKTDGSGERVGKDIMINQASMRLWLMDDSTPTLESSMARLGSYLNPGALFPIPDYQFVAEMNAEQKGDNDFKLLYGGYLNRSNGYYELDITSYVQQLAKEREGDPDYNYIPPVIFLGPAAAQLFEFGQSTLCGTDSDRPITLRITYTIIEG